jgi:hypothetical protein
MSETSAITYVAAGVDNARIVAQLATELGTRASQIASAVELLDDGATVPFIARYRKEATGGLDDTVLRNLEVRLGYLRELEERRGSILDPSRNRASSRKRCSRKSPRPTPSSAWKTCTRRTSQSAAPAPRSPAKRAWSRWPTASSPIPPATPPRSPRNT